MKSKSTWSTRVANKRRKRVVIVLAILVAIPLITLGVAEYNDQQKAHSLLGRVEEFGRSVLQSLGAVDLGSNVACAHVTDYVYSLESGPCPRAGGSWLVSMSKGQDISFISASAQAAGYTVKQTDGQDAGFSKGGLGVGVTLRGLGNDKEPHTLSSDKMWVRLNIDAQ